MLLLSEATLFFCNLLVSHTPVDDSWNNLVGKPQDWAGSVDDLGTRSQTHSRGPSRAGSQAASHSRPPPSSLSAGTTTATIAVNSSLSTGTTTVSSKPKTVSIVNSEPTNVGRQGTSNDKLASSFDNDDLDDFEEQAALARISSGKRRETVYFLFFLFFGFRC